MLSRKTRYAMLSLVKLAENYGKGPMLISDISKSEIIPQKFLEAILLDLKNIGILGSKVGKSGGYYLRRKPEDISLFEVVCHFEGGFALVPCTSEDYYESCDHCKDENKCTIRKVFQDLHSSIIGKLKSISIADLIIP
ncbi:MAG: Rrf2 family transcriptional regulator [Bacteroidota bacterium]|nr:Rrf2 family transcriptional regulator [Bacteroidota bacterium]